MSIAGIRGQQFPILTLLSIVAIVLAIVLGGMEYLDYRNQADELVSDIVMGGVDVGSLSTENQTTALEGVYVERPIFLRYNGNPILMSPEVVSFTLDMRAMNANVSSQVVNENALEGFWSYLRQEPLPPIEVELVASYSETELRAYLSDLENRYGVASSGARFNLADMTFLRGDSASRLDIETAIPLIEDALFANEDSDRSVDLPITLSQAEDPSMATLRDGILTYFDSQDFDVNGADSLASIFVIDLATGEEIGISENVRHSAVSTIKIPIMINFFRKQITAPNDDQELLLAECIICSINASANELLRMSSADDSYSGGAQRTNQTLCDAGIANTRLLASLDNGSPDQLRASGFNPDFYYAQAPDIPCNNATTIDSQTDIRTLDYDEINYTTAADMGTLLMLIHDCANNGSGLHTIFPDEITQTECFQMLEIMIGTRFHRFTENGVPDTIDIAHKVGYAGDTFGDVSIVFSPNADYVFVMYVWETDFENNGITNIDSWDLIDDVSRIVYNYFNQDQPMFQTQQPLDPNRGGTFCVLPLSKPDLDINNIDSNRFDPSGIPASTACYAYPDCIPFDNWGRE